VFIDGRRSGALSAKDRKSLIAYGGARSPILAGSLRRALAMGAARQPDDEAIVEAARMFGLGHVLDRLGGLDGKVSEGARNLSAGEGRRVMLARMALSGSRLLLLDEPDDALDTDGPQLLEQLLSMTDATALVVTHNPAIARLVGEIWLIESGELVARGAPNEMLDAGPAGDLFNVRSVA
jgi:ABC-type transport system involved in cytochrome bd biosynthesis fused ATPase/permease subunit